MARSPSGESLLTRAVRILDLFVAERPALSVAQIARQARLPASTAQRLVAELLELGLLERDGEGRVRMGLRLWEMSVRSSRALGLSEASMPYLQDIHRALRVDVQVAVLDGADVLYLEKLGINPAINVTKIAGRLPAHATSAGLVLLAFAPREVTDRVLAGPLPRMASGTLTEPAAIRRLLAHARRTGFVVSKAMLRDNATGIAVPIRRSPAEVVASLSVVVPVEDHPRRYLPALLAAAQGIGRSMGGAGSRSAAGA
ncbi:MAG: IclR family transcriptional regulator [Dermatophilaceae bacterium]